MSSSCPKSNHEIQCPEGHFVYFLGAVSTAECGLTLLNTSLLPWLAAASIPVAIHLLTRRARRKMELPTLRFLQQTLARQSKLFKWRHLLLLLVRTLAIAALVLTFLKPTISSPLAPKQGERAGAVLVLDVSASMSYSSGGLSSIARAKSEALRVLETLRSGDRANVVLCGAQPQPLLSDPTRDFPALQNAVRAVNPTEERADPTSAINLAVEQLAKTNAREKVLYLLSDFQRTNWADVKFDSVGPDTKIVFVNTDSGTRDNAGIVSMKLRPATPRVGESVMVACEVMNASASARSVPVTLSVSSGGRYSQTVALGPFSSATAMFPLKFDMPQRIECTASIPADNFALDDTRRAVIDLRQMATVVLITDEDATRSPNASFFLTRALQPDPSAHAGFRVVPVKPSQLNNPLLHSADIVIICNAPQMPQQQFQALAKWAGGGGSMVWFLYGDRIASQIQELARVVPTSDPLPFTVDSIANLKGNGKGYVTLSEARYESPLLKAFKDPSAADLSRIHFSRYVTTGEVDRRAETLLRFEDGTAAAVRTNIGSGSLLLLNTTPTPEWSDLARQEAFLPLMHELLKGMLRRDTDLREFIAGGAASATIPPAPAGQKPVLTCAGPRSAVPVTFEPTTGSVVIDQAKLCGFYRLSSQGAPVGSVAVNVSPDETDLRWIDPRELESQRQRGASFLAGVGGQADSAEDFNKGRPLWPYLLTATILFLFAEQLLARIRPRVLRSSTSNSSSNSTSVSGSSSSSSSRTSSRSSSTASRGAS